MAKRKLSKAQRVAIRKQIQSKIAAGIPKAEVLRTISTQYHVSPETVRWYLKSGTNGTPTSGSASKAASNGARAKAPSRRRSSGGAKTNGLFHLVQKVSEEGLKRALAAKKLMPRLQAKIAEKLRLESLARKVRKALRVADLQASRLQKKVARLIKG
ncbi:MAG TPA: hypothetical protein VEN81_13975 [Planctomycetota bacterium]|nr:hypothetical protein [Planctomycetota bacterium]